MIGLLCVLSIGVLGISPGSRIPLEEAKRVLDAEALTDTVGDMWDSPASIIQLKLFHMKERKKYALRGYVHALVIWIHLTVKTEADIYLQLDDAKVLTAIDIKTDGKVNARVGQTELHMTSAMLMFHKRSMKDPSPYSSSRITFLEHWFVKMWVRDYKKYDPKTWEFSDTYKKVFNGNYPPEFSDNKKWLMDVDRLYLCHLINVVPSNTDLLEECRPFPKMIPLFLNEMVQEKLRKKNSQQFKISRLKSVPKNEAPGDGGVYALKYMIGDWLWI
uniref:Ubiquitin-like protease family profile domain-containing protein n=1 Tax=Brassica oleracea var. oleracea TaxID=109376 RepID=A0A0D2ZQP7_BRAOL